MYTASSKLIYLATVSALQCKTIIIIAHDRYTKVQMTQ